jgi:hypothetical protein
MNPIRNLLQESSSAAKVRQKEEALALRAYEAMMAWHMFRKKHWESLEPLSGNAPEHVCGLQGFGRELSDVCPGCVALHAASTRSRETR